ncbi:MAG TPA: GDSL-type esterase/lipase family protein [Vicinamibacterales bacterium]|nr:GDSL-type esterase/lipase family protein [Vicinamibacterales bacterium]
MIGVRLKKLFTAAAAALAAALICMAAIEIWVRIAWDDSRGRPGFFLSDPVLGQRLAANYNGWFAGVPARTNSLGFRDTRDYSLPKPPGTFRILVFGDSVTFGHGALFETSYPYLLEQRLREWRPDVKWEVWNLGVPGYNTAQQLAYLHEVGSRYEPDLVIVGFFLNDFSGFQPVRQPNVAARARSAVMRTLQRYVYSTELYKRIYLTLRFRLFESKENQQRLTHLEDEDALLGRPGEEHASVHALGGFERLSDEDVRSFECAGIGPKGGSELAADLENRAPSLQPWFDAVQGFQDLHRSGAYRIVFFINMAPFGCTGADRFVDHGTGADNEALLEILGRDTPVVSSWREFLYYRPSQMPGAAAHSLGNANVVKAQALFLFLRDRVFPPLLPPVPAR